MKKPGKNPKNMTKSLENCVEEQTKSNYKCDTQHDLKDAKSIWDLYF